MDGGNHGGNHRRIVEEATQQGNRKGNARLRGTDRFRVAKQVVDQQIHTAGMMNTGGHHKHGHHGDQTTVTEPGQCLVGGDNATGTEHDQHCHHHQMRRKTA